MRNIVTVTGEAAATALTTLERVKAELSIQNSDNDDLLLTKIDEASSDIEAHCGRTFCRETISEQLWGEPGCQEILFLDRNPVASITSVTVDGVAVDSDEYRLDGEAGMLYRLDSSGYPCVWTWCKDIVVVYAGGFLLPGEVGRTLPPALEAGAVELVKSYWLSRGRDANVKSVDIPGVMSETYWVGAVGEDGELPPSVQEKIAPFRRPSA